MPNACTIMWLTCFDRPACESQRGVSRNHMQVRLQNDGPVTILLDSDDRNRPRRGLAVPPHAAEQTPQVGDLAAVGYVVPRHLTQSGAYGTRFGHRGKHYLGLQLL